MGHEMLHRSNQYARTLPSSARTDCTRPKVAKDENLDASRSGIEIDQQQERAPKVELEKGQGIPLPRSSDLLIILHTKVTHQLAELAKRGLDCAQESKV